MGNTEIFEQPVQQESLEYNRENLIKLGEYLATEIQKLPSPKDFNINMSSFINRIIGNNNRDLIEAPWKIKGLLSSLLEKVKGGNPETVALISQRITDHSFSEISSKEQILDKIDQILESIASDTSLDVQTKYKFFEEINKESETSFIDFTLQNLLDENGEPTNKDFIPPINYFYVINPIESKDMIQKLRELKKQIKLLESFYSQNLDKENLEQKTGQTNELYDLMANPSKGLTQNEITLAYLQVLRVYREAVNVKLAGSKDVELIIQEREEGVTDLRKGNKYDQHRRISTRRIANFQYAHVGGTYVSDIDPTNLAGNQVSIPKKLIEKAEIPDQDIQIEVRDIRDLLPSDTNEKIDKLIAIKNKYISERDRILSQIAEVNLEKLEILSDDKDSETQITALEKGSAPPEVEKYAIYRKRGTGPMSRNGKYNIFTIQDERGGCVMEIISKIEHEIGHIFQGYSVKNSLFPGLSKIPSLGRSGITAESGAIKLETLILLLFGEKRFVNNYHYTMTADQIRGKTFPQIFNHLLSEISKLPDILAIEDPEKRKKEAATRAYRSIKRLYSNLGAMGDTGNETKYPTNYLQLDYMLQGMDPYTQFNFYETGIPVNRTDLVKFLRAPIVNGRKITELDLLVNMVDTTYEVLSEKGLIAA